MTPLPFAALITLLAIAVMFWTAINVGRARAQYDVSCDGLDLGGRPHLVCAGVSKRPCQARRRLQLDPFGHRGFVGGWLVGCG